jgi:hypothetical protein
MKEVGNHCFQKKKKKKEEIVNGCHWRSETLGTLMNIVLKGL